MKLAKGGTGVFAPGLGELHCMVINDHAYGETKVIVLTPCLHVIEQ